MPIKKPPYAVLRLIRFGCVKHVPRAAGQRRRAAQGAKELASR
jgi:hypothetical protein